MPPVTTELLHCGYHRSRTNSGLMHRSKVGEIILAFGDTTQTVGATGFMRSCGAFNPHIDFRAECPEIDRLSQRAPGRLSPAPDALSPSPYNFRAKTDAFVHGISFNSLRPAMSSTSAHLGKSLIRVRLRVRGLPCSALRRVR